jgi:hypothetical protein
MPLPTTEARNYEQTMTPVPAKVSVAGGTMTRDKPHTTDDDPEA